MNSVKVLFGIMTVFTLSACTGGGGGGAASNSTGSSGTLPNVSSTLAAINAMSCTSVARISNGVSFTCNGQTVTVYDGTAGATGSAGARGATGSTGPVGNQGAVGNQGPTGNQGAAGASTAHAVTDAHGVTLPNLTYVATMQDVSEQTSVRSYVRMSELNDYVIGYDASGNMFGQLGLTYTGANCTGQIVINPAVLPAPVAVKNFVFLATSGPTHAYVVSSAPATMTVNSYTNSAGSCTNASAYTATYVTLTQVTLPSDVQTTIAAPLGVVAN